MKRYCAMLLILLVGLTTTGLRRFPKKTIPP
jgi:hypothetical protein